MLTPRTTARASATRTSMTSPTRPLSRPVSTAALRSKRMMEPSGRRMSLRTRTTTAFITSPFFTRPRGMASLTETTMTSPTVAYLRLEPPSTLIHMTRRAPELSATSRLVCIWIMMHLVLYWCCAHGASLCLLLALDHGPALELGERTVLLDPDRVPDREFVLIIVSVIVLGASNRLFQQRVGEAAFD